MQILLVGAYLGVTIVFFGLLVVLSFSSEISDLITPTVLSLLKDIVGPVAAGFGGAIAGAYAAYFLSRSEALRIKKEKEAEEKRVREMQEIQEINVTLVGLFAKLNDVWTIKKSYFDPWEDEPLRFLTIPPFTMPLKVPERISNSTIANIECLGLDNAVRLFYMADEGYYAILDNLSARGALLRDIRELMSANGCANGVSVGLRDYLVYAGIGRLVALYINTEELIRQIKAVSSDLIASISALTNMADQKYKGKGVSIIKHGVISRRKFKMSLPHYKNVDELKDFFKELERRATV
ncbi:hypothetical protein AAEO47_06825 [Pseudomonas aeruginosa]|uniref:hypothetical protein n=1 Tax=Pseudomonas aeruginosa TaxID=287 RepID=UPI0031342DE6